MTPRNFYSNEKKPLKIDKAQVLRELKVIFNRSPRNIYSAKALAWYFDLPFHYILARLHELEAEGHIVRLYISLSPRHSHVEKPLPRTRGVYWLLAQNFKFLNKK